MHGFLLHNLQSLTHAHNSPVHLYISPLFTHCLPTIICVVCVYECCLYVLLFRTICVSAFLLTVFFLDFSSSAVTCIVFFFSV